LQGIPKHPSLLQQVYTIKVYSLKQVLRGLQNSQLTVFTGSESTQKLHKILQFYPHSTLILEGNVIGGKDLS
jgi:hypothetical protein